MNIYSKAPVISRLHPRGIVAEGVVPDRETKLTFNLAVESFGFVVPPLRYITGAQWVEQIKANFDSTNPRTAAVIESIKTVMLVDQFKDDYIVVKKETAEAVYRGKAAECQRFITSNGGARLSKFEGTGFDVIPTKDVDGVMLIQADENTAIRYLVDNFATGAYRRDGFFTREKDAETRERHLASGQARSLVDLGLPLDVVYYPASGDKANILARILDLLKVSPVGTPQFTPEQQADRASSIDLIALLCNLHGYGALVTSAKGVQLKRAADEKPRNMLHPTMVESSMMDFIESLEEAGWDGDSDLFVCRPASSYNTLMNIRPHESLVHNELIGWRIPRGVVAQLRDELHELQGQKHDVRAHGERAA
jgi:hypothetical protein